jgi:hypothetical protein
VDRGIGPLSIIRAIAWRRTSLSFGGLAERLSNQQAVRAHSLVLDIIDFEGQSGVKQAAALAH